MQGGDGGGPDRRAWDDRRGDGDDRRHGLDRRGSGLRQPPSATPRAYVFREFGERRSYQDRRLYGADGSWDRRGAGDRPAPAEPVVVLSEEEIRCLLGRQPRRR